MTKTRKGFTLVELLIVIVVIGILTAMMMLSSNEAVSTAKANNIASNLRNLKTAALAYYTDNIAEALSVDIAQKHDTIFKYLGEKTKIPDSADYSFVGGGTDNKEKWYVQYNIQSTLAGVASIKTKLKGRTSTLGLLNANNDKYNGDSIVRLRIR